MALDQSQAGHSTQRHALGPALSKPTQRTFRFFKVSHSVKTVILLKSCFLFPAKDQRHCNEVKHCSLFQINIPAITLSPNDNNVLQHRFYSRGKSSLIKISIELKPIIIELGKKNSSTIKEKCHFLASSSFESLF